MELVNKIYRDINGSLFYFIGVGISIITIITSVALYTTGGGSYSILTNFVSDLGATSAPNNAFIAFNIGLILNSIISPFGTLFLAFLFLKNDIKLKWIVWLWVLVNIISSIATFLVALFPEDTMLGPHIVAAIITFFFGMISYIIYGILTIIMERINNIHSLLGFLLAALSIIFMSSWVLRIELSLITLLEWLVMFGGWGFGLYLGIMCLKLKKRLNFRFI
ncbi:MAG: DUF998 domain-containing protein [Candidatus Thorarchaeota archaeon]